MELAKLTKGFVFILSIYFVTAVPRPSSRKQYRNDYVYNKNTDAFYKIHIESAKYSRAQDTCAAEGGSLMVPATDRDIKQAHALFKRYPDLGPYLWVGDDGVTHESAEEESMIQLVDLTDDVADVLTRNGEIETYRKIEALPFICKVLARDAPYNAQCDVYSAGYEYNATVSSCYKISIVAYPWGQAASECEAEGAHLAIINSKTEDDAIREVLRRGPSAFKHSVYNWFFFIGVRAKREEPGKERVFMTIFNETLEQAGYNEWSENEPNNAGHSEYCGTIFKNNGKLNDVDCTHNYPFLCEKEIHRPSLYLRNE